MATDNVELARRGFDAALRGDLDVLADLLDPDVKWHGGDPTAEGSCHGRDEALRFIGRAVALRGSGVELVDVVGAGDQVVVILRPPPVGDERPAPVANVTTFREGKVVEVVHYPSPGDALAAAGVA
jgi:ketosteroid isomerase-like protein